jgi:hypothetical protein
MTVSEATIKSRHGKLTTDTTTRRQRTKIDSKITTEVSTIRNQENRIKIIIDMINNQLLNITIIIEATGQMGLVPNLIDITRSPERNKGTTRSLKKKDITITAVSTAETFKISKSKTLMRETR